MGLQKPVMAAQLVESKIREIMDELEQHDCPYLHWHHFFHARTDVDWSRLHAFPTMEDLSKKSRCGCSLDPMSICQQHRCQCGCTKAAAKASADTPNSSAEALQSCKWREAHSKYLQKMPNMTIEGQAGRLTYCEVLEMNNKPAPASARERNLLNILAYESQPAQSAYAVLDKTQTIGRTGFRSVGLLPTFCKSSQLWSTMMGQQISAEWMAALFGHVNSDFTGLSRSSVMSLLGNSMHLADVGTIMACGVLIKAGFIQ